MSSLPPVDVVCLGESMVTFLPSRPGPLADVPSFDRAIGGAESNVACTLARSGHDVRWVSRVGADGFGEHLVRTIRHAGVRTDAVARDEARPTGIYFRTAGERATGVPGQRTAAEVAYYRAGSAASAMSPDTVPTVLADSGRILHLTGITAALSAGCLELLRVLTAPRPDRPLISFDLNYRAPLWRSATHAGPEVLWELARDCDLVFVGEDEAEAVAGVTGGPAAVRAALGDESQVVVVKQGAAGATVFGGGDTALHVPAPRVDVVTEVGAGDAFAAGFLSATLHKATLRDSLRHGHLCAAAALTVPGDLAPPPSSERAAELRALPDELWAQLHLAPGWTEADTATV